MNQQGAKMKNGKSKGDKKRALNKDALIKSFFLVLSTYVFGISILWGKEYNIETLIGTFLIIVVLLAIFYKDMTRYKPEIRQDYTQIFLIVLLLSANLLLGRTFYYVLEGFSEWLGTINPSLPVYAIPLATGSMLAALLIDIHAAILFTVITSLIAGLWLNNPLYSIFTFVGGLTAAFSVVRCKKRSAIWRAGLFVGLVSMLTSFAISLLSANLFNMDMFVTMVAAFMNGVIVAVFVSALLPLFEHFFKLTTDISLLELLDLNHPLLHELLVEAPGTYHHSVVVGNLVETAAEAVGVNPLLARVSAYYHDIGKIKMPEYFIENQVGPLSMHDKLTPRMSSIVLIGHIKEGVEMAKKHKLPNSIIDIMQQHHGTSVQTYFYERAKEQQEESAAQVSRDDFRYPGPKPRTRVAALVLMADAVEAASRVLYDPTAHRVSALVDKIINHCFIDGQLDNCELTLKDIREIKINFVYMLTSIYHKRIDYPGFEIKHEDTPKEPTKTQAY
jgi:hypothetical protein